MRTARFQSITIVILFLAVIFAPQAMAGSRGVDLEVVVGGRTLPKYFHQDTTWVEAARGRDYSLRLTNPTAYRVAVALSVDGLNTIDARHTEGWNAAKWVLEPWESIEISGWQVSERTARRFVFTGETSSYGAALGQTENLGIIEAIVYRERPRPVARFQSPTGKSRAEAAEAAPSAGVSAESSAELSDAHAATGMGDRTRHDVRRVRIDLDREPVGSMRIRYEFRPELVRLGVIPEAITPAQRRERARGFREFCPEP
jgi:hypothetical protein